MREKLSSKSWGYENVKAPGSAKLKAAYIPCTVYRLQFEQEMSFSGARDILSYLSDLGMTALYVSPYFKTIDGSLHGYNITDPSALNPALGSVQEFHSFLEELKKYSIAQILDIVPNHMGIGMGNRYGMDVLENGRGAIFAKFSEI